MPWADQITKITPNVRTYFWVTMWYKYYGDIIESQTHVCAASISKKAFVIVSLSRRKYRYTVCPRSRDPFYIVIYYIKWFTTSWTHSKWDQFKRSCFRYSQFFGVMVEKERRLEMHLMLKLKHKNLDLPLQIELSWFLS